MLLEFCVKVPKYAIILSAHFSTNSKDTDLILKNNIYTAPLSMWFQTSRPWEPSAGFLTIWRKTRGNWAEEGRFWRRVWY